MKDILARENRHVLAELASSDVLLAFDYDGTLAPIVRDPEAAYMREDTRELLERVASAYPCVVISGRSQADVQARVSGAALFEIIGNHGLEPRVPRESDAERVRTWVPALASRLAEAPGVVIEDKQYSIAVHYRRAEAPQRARLAILHAARGLEGVRVIGGKSVVNLVPSDGPHKGTALETAREKLRCEMALYVGDDETDEDVFGLEDAAHLVTVRVGAKQTSRAAYYLADQKSVDVLLSTLLELREQLWRRSS